VVELTPVEQRVVGSLIEKERATPQNYPLTLNALRLACNQSSNRDPVLDLDEHEIETALSSLREQGLTRIVYSTSNRAAKYRHVIDEQWHLGDDDLAVVAVLLLRGPQTIGEIKGRSERLHDFADLAAVQVALDRLAAREDGALVERLDRRPGQKDARWIHRLGPVGATPSWDAPTDDDLRPHPAPAPGPASAAPATNVADRPPSGDDAGLAAAVAELTAELSLVRQELEDLRAAFEVFRTQFD
jgi:uncharacterized protein YceH (UPF0502 family)